MNVLEIKSKYNLSENSYYKKSPYGNSDTKVRDEHVKNHYQPFYDKWIKYTAEGWYGPGGLGYPMPEMWYTVLDDFLEGVLERCPDFRIHQIKIKFGGVRIYLAGVPEEIREECRELERLLFDKFLIY